MPTDLFPTWDSVWDMATGKETSKLEVLSMAISPDGKTIVSGSCDNTVR